MRRRPCFQRRQQQQRARTLRSPLSRCWEFRGVSHRYGWGLSLGLHEGRRAKRVSLWLEDASWWVISRDASLDPRQFSRDARRIALDSRVAFVVFACGAAAALSGFPRSRCRVRLRLWSIFFSGVSSLNCVRRPYTTRRLLLPTTRRRRPVRGGSKRDRVTSNATPLHVKDTPTRNFILNLKTEFQGTFFVTVAHIPLLY